MLPSLRKSSERWEIRATFEILVNIKNKEILDRIQKFFGVGKIYIIKKKVYYRVTKIGDIVNILIPHFKSYPLLSKKICRFIVWCEAIKLIEAGTHKTKKGFTVILNQYAAISKKDIPEKIKTLFPNLVPEILPDFNIKEIELNPWWLSGYLTLYCNFTFSVLAGGWKQDI